MAPDKEINAHRFVSEVVSHLGGRCVPAVQIFPVREEGVEPS